jgi:hypothetical protein
LFLQDRSEGLLTLEDTVKLYIIHHYQGGQHQGEDWDSLTTLGYYTQEVNARKAIAELLETSFFDYDAVPGNTDCWDKHEDYDSKYVSGFTDSTLILDTEETED